MSDQELIPDGESQGTPVVQPEIPSSPKPWYYRPEYMIPMFVFWPAWSVLVLRSPWNQNTMMGGVAWALLIMGAVLGFRWIQGGEIQPIMTFYVPGILLTIITQVQWAAYRSQLAKDAAAESGDSEAAGKPPRPTARRRRRNSRTGRSKN